MFKEDVTKSEQTVAIYLKKAKGIIKWRTWNREQTMSIRFLP